MELGDLETLLILIATVAAGILAILGGLVFSSEHTLNKERMNLVEGNFYEHSQRRLRYVGQKKALADEIEHIQNTQLILGFIREHVEEVMQNKHLEEVYNEGDDFILSTDDMSIFWNEAIDVCSRCRYLIEKNADSLNSDNVPFTLLETYKDDIYGLSLCGVFGSLFRKRKDDMSLGTIVGQKSEDEVIDEGFDRADKLLKGKEQDVRSRINELDFKISEEKAFNRAIREEMSRLQKRCWTRAGIVIFTLFAVSSVIAPMGFLIYIMACSTEKDFLSAGLGFFITFVAGLLAIIVYMILNLLLNRNRDDSNHNTRKPQ